MQATQSSKAAQQSIKKEVELPSSLAQRIAYANDEKQQYEINQSIKATSRTIATEKYAKATMTSYEPSNAMKLHRD